MSLDHASILAAVLPAPGHPFGQKPSLAVLMQGVPLLPHLLV